MTPLRRTMMWGSVTEPIDPGGIAEVVFRAKVLTKVRYVGILDRQWCFKDRCFVTRRPTWYVLEVYSPRWHGWDTMPTIIMNTGRMRYVANADCTLRPGEQLRLHLANASKRKQRARVVANCVIGTDDL
jgi:hypothetical protein